MSDWRDTPINKVEHISARARRALRNDGFETLGQVADASEYDLLRIPDFGRISLAEVKAILSPDKPSGFFPLPPTSSPLRDWFAGQAMIGLLIDEGMGDDGRPIEDTCRDAYRYADAMLEAREKKQ